MESTPEQLAAKAQAKAEAKAAKQAAKEAGKATKSGATAVAVHDANGQFVREYSHEVHGEHFVKNAEEFASHPARAGYTVHKLR